MPVTTTIKSTRGARPKHWPKWQNAANNVAGWEYYNICSIPISYILYHAIHVRMKIYICHDLLLFRAVVLLAFFFFVVFGYYLNFK